MTCLASDFITQLMERGELLKFVIFTGGIGIGIIAVVLGGVRGIVVARARERTKREIAAYVAEGSLEPDKAVALINAGRTNSCRDRA